MQVVQWGGARVWKIGGKVFAIGGWNEGGELYVTFKCSELSYHLLASEPGLRPAPYLASRGLKWIQRMSQASLDDENLKAYLSQSYRLVVGGLTRKQKRSLGMAEGK